MDRTGAQGAGAEGARPGRVLDGRYRLDEQIARGGMATVHRATDLRLDRTVAVKVMHDGLAGDDDFCRRFQREARAAARLSHPGVVSVFDTGDDDGTLYLVMELVRGRTLRQVIRDEAPLPAKRALRLMEPVLEALGAAHAAGIVHRDVKPENVLVPDATTDGGDRVKVADFGLSRAVSSETQHTATGEVLIGTVSYLSPELVVDNRADARADVYAAGVVLFELLTATKPHQADSPIQVAYKHVHEDVPAPSARVEGGLPDYVDALVARATSRAVELRPADARVLLHQVRQVRIAVEQGVAHDADLVADLSPTAAGRLLAADSHEALAETGTDELPEIRTVRDAVHERELVGAGAAGGRSDSVRVGPAPGHGGAYDDGPDGGDDGNDDGDSNDSNDGDEATTVHHRTAGLGGPLVPTQRRTDDDPVAPVRGRRRRRRGPVALLLVLLLVGAAVAGTWWYAVARYTETPSVLNLTQAAAQERLAEAGLALGTADPAYDERVPEGEIISSDPAPGERVLDEGTVTVVLSLGPERYDVPDLRGRTLDEAQQALGETNLGFAGTQEQYDEEVPEGQVIATDPAAGTSLRPDSAVEVLVSRGPEPIEVPDTTGRGLDEARATLSGAGFEVASREEHSDTVAQGAVIAQNPSDGTLARGDTVEVVVSLGPVMVEVPRVIGQGVADATARLEAAGFTVVTERSSLYIGVQYVVSQEPGGGSAPQGSTISLGIV